MERRSSKSESSAAGDTDTGSTHTHTWDSGTETVKATRYTTGVTTYSCTLCGETYEEEIAATGGSASRCGARTGGMGCPPP